MYIDRMIPRMCNAYFATKWDLLCRPIYFLERVKRSISNLVQKQIMASTIYSHRIIIIIIIIIIIRRRDIILKIGTLFISLSFELVNACPQILYTNCLCPVLAYE